MDLQAAAARLVALGDSIVPVPTGITVLIYHRIGAGTGGAVDTDLDVFRAQLAHLGEHHRVISLDDAVRELGSTATAPPAENGVVITFDDGTDDFALHALPALVEARLPATLFACTRSIDDGSPFPWGAAPTSWEALREATSTGLVTVGSHTHTHVLLDRTPEPVVRDELDRSIDLIGEQLGQAPIHFAHPKAIAGSPAAERLVRERFVSASLARSRVNRPGRADVYRIWRTPVQRLDDLDRFAAKAAGRARVEGEVRHAVTRWKYRGAVT